jgi:hypothetical protein
LEKEYGNIKITETDEGYRIEVKGKDLKEAFAACCCMPMSGSGKAMKSGCCEPEKESK